MARCGNKHFVLALHNRHSIENVSIASTLKHPRWKKLRWVGLVIMSIYCGSLVAVEVTRTAWEEGVNEREFSATSSGCVDDIRCVSEVGGAALSVKWISQLLNNIFQVRF